MKMPQSFNMAAYVLAAGARTPDKTALTVVGAAPFAMTYGELTAAVRGVATGLIAAGGTPGARVLLRLDNSPHFPICYLGAIAAGLVPVPTSSQLTRPEVNKIAATVTPAITLASAGLALPDQMPVCLTADDISAMQTLPAADYDMGDPHRPAYIVFTSGTSGQPRAVVHAHRAVLARQMMFDGWYGLGRDDRMMHAGAFNWTYTMGTGLIDPWTVGATSVIPAADVQAAALPGLIAAHQISIFAAAPGVYRKLLTADIPTLADLRHGLSAGEKLPDLTRRRWQDATGTPIFEAYGMSECSTFISGSPARPAPAGTLGFAQTGRRIALMADGTIAVHQTDPGLMLGYFNDPVATADKFAGEWFLTGDIGEKTDSGAIRYAGRNDDMINAGGLRVSPVDIEDALAQIAPTCEWAAVEVRLRTDVSLIAAFHAGPDVIDENQIRDALHGILAAYKIPRLFVSVENLPRGANNKLLRRRLRTDWETAHGQT